MFKKGQVWRGIRNKSHVIIVERVNDALSMVDVKFIDGPRTGQKGWVHATTVKKNECAHIGNNYQERPTKQAQPGTAFKRWLGEMTSGIPEQRGCRKEDC